ncbi:protein kinase [Streptomyces sp. NPDC050560]|uniref:serine/threonine-protein kinase n=1 Tax=Streptomyces sp. NPDC050560 TaxID=3365630 RepID=UPI0037BD6EF4
MQGLLLAGRYRLGESIGRGGMGRVWRAHDEVLNRAVAVKELTAAQFVSDSDRSVMLARTQTEARAAARVNHPAVVTVHDVLEHDDRPWIVMELVQGRSLADAVKESGRIDIRYAAHAGLWVLRALRAAHAAGVLHRDVKPGNVLLADDGRVLLTDFGIAQVEGDTTLTKTGEVVGSVDYLAPERVRGADPGPASDLWALGATLYTAVEGRSPFRRTTPLITMQAVVDEEPAPPDAGVLTPVIMALLRKDPLQRPTADAAEHMLLEAAEGRAPTGAAPHAPTATYPFAPGTPGYGGTATHPAPPYEPPREQPYGSPYHHAAYTHPAQHPADTAAPSGIPTGATTHEHRRTGRRGRGRRGLIAAIALAAALVGGGTAVALLHFTADGGESRSSGPTDDPTADDPTRSPTGSPTHKPSPRPSDVPDGWHRVHDATGFTLVVPKGWKRQVSGSQVDYTPDNGDHFVRIAVDKSPDWDTPNEHQLDLESQLKDRLPEYRRVGLEANTYRDRSGSRWEFTWTAKGGDDDFPGPRRAVEETYYDHNGAEYAIYMSSSADDWPTTREQFDTVLRGWRAPAD